MISKNSIILALSGALFANLITGCSSQHDQIKLYFSCMYVAEQLEKPEAGEIIRQKLMKYVEEEQIPMYSDKDMVFMMDEIRNEDLKEYRYGAKALIDHYNSSDCMDLHEQEEFSVLKELGLF